MTELGHSEATTTNPGHSEAPIGAEESKDLRSFTSFRMTESGDERVVDRPAGNRNTNMNRKQKPPVRGKYVQAAPGGFVVLG